MRGEGGGSQELFIIFACECAKMFAGAQRDSVRLGAGTTPHAAAPPAAHCSKTHRTCSWSARRRAPRSWFAHSRVCQCHASALRLHLWRLTLPLPLSLGESCGDTRRHVSPLTGQPTPSGSSPPAPSIIPLELPTDLSLRALSLRVGPSAESTPLGFLAPQISCAAPRRALPGCTSCLSRPVFATGRWASGPPGLR
jgi:hypothetical protein